MYFSAKFHTFAKLKKKEKRHTTKEILLKGVFDDVVQNTSEGCQKSN
jgi:hypothetical protein